MKLFTIVFALILSMATSGQTQDLASDEEGEETVCFPKNDLRRPVGPDISATNGMTEQVFNQVLDRVEKVYQPIFSSYGYRLKLVLKWQDATINHLRLLPMPIKGWNV